MRVAVVGHVEWVEFARVDHAPAPGEIVHALETWEEPAGGGAVAAVQLARLAGDCLFLTALGDDELGRRAAEGLERLGVRVEVAWRDEPCSQSRAASSPTRWRCDYAARRRRGSDRPGRGGGKASG